MIFETIGQELRLVELDIIASDSKDFLEASFILDEAWEGYGLTAVFMIDKKNVYAQALANDTTCKINWEALQNAGRFFVGIYGVKNGVRITSTLVEIYKEKGAWLGTSKHTDGLHMQVYNMVESLRNDNLDINEQMRLKQALFVAGSNIAITDNPDGSQTISAFDVELFVVVDELPKIGEAGRIYLVSEDGGSFHKWTWRDNKWVDLGTLTVELDILYNKQEFDGFLLQRAGINSPRFTGVPTAPTAVENTANRQVATTAFIMRLIKPFFLREPVVTIHFSVNGSTTGFGLNRNEPVTFARAVEVAHMCDGRGIINMNHIGTGNITGGQYVFHGIKRVIIFNSETSIFFLNSVLEFLNCKYFEFACTVSIVVTRDNTLLNLIIKSSNFFFDTILTTGGGPATVVGRMNVIASRGHISELAADGTYMYLYDGSTVRIAKGNAVRRIADGSILFSNSNVLGNVGTKENGGQIFKW